MNQTLETNPDQTSIVICVRGMKQKLKDQLVMKFQLAHFIAIHGKLFELYSDFANFEKEFHNVDLGNSYLSDTSCHKMLKLGSAIFIKFLFFSPNDSPSKTMKNAFYFIKKALFVPKIIKFFYFHPSLFFSLSAIALEDDQR